MKKSGQNTASDPLETNRFAIICSQAFSLINFRSPLIRDIIARGHQVYALAPDFDDETCAQVRAIGAEPVSISLSRTGLNPLRDVADMARLRKVLAGLDLDTVLSFAIKPVIYGTLAAKHAGIPARHVLVTGLGYAFTENSQISLKRRMVGLGARFLYWLALRYAQTVFMQNPDDAEDFVRMGIADATKLVTVNGTGVELDKWQPVAPLLAPVTFLLAARMLRDKGVLEFVEAARAVKTRNPSVRFVLVGGLDTNPEAIGESQIAGWVDEGVVEWLGHVDIKFWLAQTSVFVLPSYREGVPRSTQEAMAMGRAVITTDVPGCRETVVHDRNGFLVPPRDPGALADAMKRFIAEPELIKSMGIESRKLAEERFDVRKVNATMIAEMNL